MKRPSIYIILALCMAVMTLTMSSCQKDSIKGKLDAQWQIMKIENLSDGTVEIPSSGRYICFYLHVVNLRPAEIAGNMNYDKSAATVSMDFPYITADQTSRLASWGIYSNPVVFHVVTVNGKELVLRSDDAVITCRRY